MSAGPGVEPRCRADPPAFAVNLGKWVLSNLFAGLLKAEAADAAEHVAKTTPSTTNSALPSLNRSPAPNFISIDRVASNRRTRSYSTLSNNPQTPGALMVGLATPAIVPAVLSPENQSQNVTSYFSHDWAARHATPGGLAAIPGSPATLNPGTTPAALKSPKGEVAAKDYFSSRGGAAKTSKPPGPKDPSPDRSGVPQTPGGSAIPQTPGGSFMGKFKGFGGNKAKKPVETQVGAISPTIEEPEEEEETVCITMLG